MKLREVHIPQDMMTHYMMPIMAQGLDSYRLKTVLPTNSAVFLPSDSTMKTNDRTSRDYHVGIGE